MGLEQIDEKQRQRIGELEKDLTTATQRFDSLREHAEAKLDEANVEIARVRASYEKELSALRAKLSRVEIQMQSLELNLQAKTQENVELTKICDDLVSQMERMAA
ncbi:transforming acidic coiled-coil-containing protein-domain containing protein [Entophlyctis helioformis]|nr:transforming acidic coiled-coil-containing protein-domain containing protein [Entophlyctis helioformis]